MAIRLVSLDYALQAFDALSHVPDQFSKPFLFLNFEQLASETDQAHKNCRQMPTPVDEGAHFTKGKQPIQVFVIISLLHRCAG